MQTPKAARLVERRLGGKSSPGWFREALRRSEIFLPAALSPSCLSLISLRVHVILQLASALESHDPT